MEKIKELKRYINDCFIVGVIYFVIGLISMCFNILEHFGYMCIGASIVFMVYSYILKSKINKLFGDLK